MTNDEGNVMKISPFSHTQLLLAISMRGNVASYLFGKPPNPRRGTSWKRRQTSPSPLQKGNVETGIIPLMVLPFRFYLRKLCVKHS